MSNSDSQEIVRRLEKLEKAVFASKSKGKQNKPLTPKRFIGAKGGILLLIENSFFEEPRTAPETKTAMRENGYHYNIQVVQTTLNRLSSTTGPLTAMRDGKNKVYVKRK